MSNVYKDVAKITAQSQKDIQKLINSANTQQMKYNAEEANTSREWQKMMSESAHQMEVEDLKKAGLNPVLSSGGSGAQSYTTSSAQASLESGANALASLQSSRIGVMGNIESSRIAAAAQKEAAAASAAAMRSAAAQSAAAQIYAANKSFDKAIKVAKIQASANKWIATNKQATNPFALADKYLGSHGFSLSLPKNLTNVFKAGNAKLSSYLSNAANATKNNFKLSGTGNNTVGNFLSKNRIRNTQSNRNLAVKAFMFGDSSSVNKFMAIYTSSNKAHRAKNPPHGGHR